MHVWLKAAAADMRMFSLTVPGAARNIYIRKFTASGVANLSPAELLYAVMFSRVLQA